MITLQNELNTQKGGELETLSDMRLIKLQPTQKHFSSRLLQVSKTLKMPWPCTKCEPEDALSMKCDHIEKCSECTIYQIEKLMRCETCCQQILGFIPPFCGSSCKASRTTYKSTPCNICSGTLRRSCASCKNTDWFKNSKGALKSHVQMYITALDSITMFPALRPCCHCKFCVRCNTAVSKGHRERNVCLKCKANPKSRLTKYPPTFHKLNPGKKSGALKYILNAPTISPDTNVELPETASKLPSFMSLMATFES